MSIFPGKSTHVWPGKFRQNQANQNWRLHNVSTMAKMLILALFEPSSQVCKHLEQKRVTEMAPNLFPHLLPYLGMPYMALTQLFGSEPTPPSWPTVQGLCKLHETRTRPSEGALNFKFCSLPYIFFQCISLELCQILIWTKIHNLSDQMLSMILARNLRN